MPLNAGGGHILARVRLVDRVEPWPAAVRDDCAMPERRAVGAVTRSLDQFA
jgi:hypothetical protein